MHPSIIYGKKKKPRFEDPDVLFLEIQKVFFVSRLNLIFVSLRCNETLTLSVEQEEEEEGEGYFARFIFQGLSLSLPLPFPFLQDSISHGRPLSK